MSDKLMRLLAENRLRLLAENRRLQGELTTAIQEAKDARTTLAAVRARCEATMRPEDEPDAVVFFAGFSEREIQLATTVAVVAINGERARTLALLDAPTATCAECGGRGAVLDAPARALDGRAYVVPCPLCHGTGKTNAGPKETP